MRTFLAVIPASIALAGAGAVIAQADHGHEGQAPGHVRQVVIPGEDRFAPFALTIHAGETVRWVNKDSDDHTVVSDDAFDTAGHQGTDMLVSSGRTFELTFTHPGTFVYYCRFHAHLDGFNQPVAPGPEGGIQDANGNFGTPMSGVITVLPRDEDNR